MLSGVCNVTSRRMSSLRCLCLGLIVYWEVSLNEVMSPLFKGEGPGCQKNRLICHPFKGTESFPGDFSWSVMGATAHLQSFWEPGGSAVLDLGEAEVISSPLTETLSPGWTRRVWKAVKFGVCWHLRFPFAVFWIFYPSWGFMHKDACYWIWWIDTWLQGFFSDCIPVTSNFQVWKLLWYLYSGLAHLVRRCITWTRESNWVFGEDGFSLRRGCRSERAACLLPPCESKEPAKSTSAAPGCGIAHAFQFLGCFLSWSERVLASWEALKMCHEVSLQVEPFVEGNKKY